MAPTRERDARGRFVKKTKPVEKPMNNENDFHHQTLRTYNRLADGGHEYDINDARDREVWMSRCMTALWIILIAFLTCLLIGCRTERIVEYVPIEKKVKEVVIEKDTVLKVQLVPYKDSIATPDSTSHLENQYAYSDAAVKGGRLTHTLGIFPNNPVDVPAKIIIKHEIDSIPYPVPVPGPTQYLEHEPTFIEKVLTWTGGVTLLMLFAFVAFKVEKFF